MMRNKRGWIRIVEAVIALFLITGVLLIVIDKGYIGKKDISSEMYKVQLSILREIQIDDNLRTSILNISAENLPADENVPQAVVDKVNERKPDYIDCKVRVCKLGEVCSLDIYPQEAVGKDIYAQSVAITAILTEYSPRQLKLFCWEK